MLELFVHGICVCGRGAAGALAAWGGETLARFQKRYPPDRIRSALEAELGIIAEALEWARDHGGMGEAVTVRTGLGSLASACRGRGAATPPELREPLRRLEALAADFEGIHAELSPPWSLAPARTLALRCLREPAGARAMRRAR